MSQIVISRSQKHVASVYLNDLLTWLFFSGEELFHQMRPGEISLPEKSGDKDYSPDGSWLQEKKLETFLRDRHLALQEERIKKMLAFNNIIAVYYLYGAYIWFAIHSNNNNYILKISFR